MKPDFDSVAAAIGRHAKALTPGELTLVLEAMADVIRGQEHVADPEINRNHLALVALSPGSVALEAREGWTPTKDGREDWLTVVLISFEGFEPYKAAGPQHWTAAPIGVKATAECFDADISRSLDEVKLDSLSALIDAWPGDITPEVMPAETYRFCRDVFRMFPGMDLYSAAVAADCMACRSSTRIGAHPGEWGVLPIASLAFADHKSGTPRKLRGNWLGAEDAS